jgi:hypothetical protein
MLQNLAEKDTVGTLEEGLERNRLNVEHQHSLSLLDLTFGEAQVGASNVNKTRIPSRRKCSQRVSPMQ